MISVTKVFVFFVFACIYSINFDMIFMIQIMLFCIIAGTTLDILDIISCLKESLSVVSDSHSLGMLSYMYHSSCKNAHFVFRLAMWQGVG